MFNKTEDSGYHSMKKIASLVFMGLALVILIDFLLSSTQRTSQIISIEREVQSHNNASGNSHFSFLVHTEEDSFYVTEEDAQIVKVGYPIQYELSPIFNEVNRYTIGSETKTYSLRLFTGLIFPLFALVVLIASLKYQQKMSILTFVIEVALLVDLYLLIQ